MDKKQDGQKKAAKTGNKRLLIVMVAVVVIAIAAIAVYMFLLQPAKASGSAKGSTTNGLPATTANSGNPSLGNNPANHPQGNKPANTPTGNALVGNASCLSNCMRKSNYSGCFQQCGMQQPKPVQANLTCMSNCVKQTHNTTQCASQCGVQQLTRPAGNTTCLTTCVQNYLQQCRQQCGIVVPLPNVKKPGGAALPPKPPQLNGTKTP